MPSLNSLEVNHPVKFILTNSFRFCYMLWIEMTCSTSKSFLAHQKSNFFIEIVPRASKSFVCLQNTMQTLWSKHVLFLYSEEKVKVLKDFRKKTGVIKSPSSEINMWISCFSPWCHLPRSCWKEEVFIWLTVWGVQSTMAGKAWWHRQLVTLSWSPEAEPDDGWRPAPF